MHSLFQAPRWWWKVVQSKENRKTHRGWPPPPPPPFPSRVRASYFRFARFNTFPLYYLRAWHRLTCAQPYHPGNSHGQLFCPYWGSSAWHSRRVHERGNPCVSKTLYCRGECKAFLKAPAPHNTCGSCWLGTARHFSHDMRREGGSGVTLICVQVFASGKRKTDENLMFDENFTCIQCSTEKFSFFEQHFCGKFVYLYPLSASFFVFNSTLCCLLEISKCLGH